MLLPADTARRLRAAGLTVIEIPGWQTRGRPASTGSFNPVGVLNHHTGARDEYNDAEDDLAYAKWLFTVGRSDLPAPLCHLSLSLEGVVYLGAAGRANHAGTAKASGSVAAGDGNTLYVGIEWMLSGTQEIPGKMYQAGAILNAVLLDILDSSEQAVSCHYQTSTTGKWDIGDPDGIPFNGRKVLDVPAFRRLVRAHMNELSEQVKTRFMSANFKGTMAPDGSGPSGAKAGLGPAQDRAKMALRRAMLTGCTVVGGQEVSRAQIKAIRNDPELSEIWRVLAATPNTVRRDRDGKIIAAVGNALFVDRRYWKVVEHGEYAIHDGVERLHQKWADLHPRHIRTDDKDVRAVAGHHRAGRSPHARDARQKSRIGLRKALDGVKRVVLLFDWNEPAAFPSWLAYRHKVDGILVRGLRLSKGRTHFKFKGTVSDHAAISALVEG